MIGLDTNVLLRWLVDDGEDRAQRSAARRALADRPVFISVVTLVETMGVLRTGYRRPWREIVELTRAVLANAGVTVENAGQIGAALRDWEAFGADPADHIVAHAGAAGGCETTLTFDNKASRSPHMRLLTP